MALRPPPYHTSASGSGEADVEEQRIGDDKDIDAFRREYDRRHAELLEARREIAQLKLDLAEAQARAGMDRFWIGHHMDYGSEVFSYSFASTVLSGSNPGVRLYVNQNNTMSELIYHEVIPDQYTTPQWGRGFVFPGALMPNSAIAAANSEFSSQLIGDGADRGRDVIRVFFFEPDGTLREWMHDSAWHKTDLQIRGADPRNVSAICWAQGGFAEWSMFYITKKERRLFERRLFGGTGQWSVATEIPWSRSTRKSSENFEETTQFTNSLHSAFTVTTNDNGTDRRIFYLDSSNGDVPAQFHTLKWGYQGRYKWSKIDYPDAQGFPSHSWEGSMPSYHGLCLDGPFNGIRLYFQHEDEIIEWMSSEDVEGGKWVRGSLGSEITSPGATISATRQLVGNQFRQLVFSVAEDRIIQTTFANIGKEEWHSKPIVIRNL